MTQTVTLGEGLAHVFVAVDHCNTECVGIHADNACPDIVLLLLGGAMTLEHINFALFEYPAPAIKPNLM